jgi:hypothetical protein
MNVNLFEYERKTEQARCVCGTQMPPYVANSKGGHHCEKSRSTIPRSKSDVPIERSCQKESTYEIPIPSIQKIWPMLGRNQILWYQ